MKLVTFRHGADGALLLGALRGEAVVALSGAEGHDTRGYDTRGLDSMAAYLEGLPVTGQRAAAILADSSQVEIPMHEVHLGPAVPAPTALLDCGLSPRHLRLSSRTLLRHSLPVGIGRPLGMVLGTVAARSRRLSFYKGNHHSISGPGDEITWPDYTAYLDIEPELAIVTGREPQRRTDRIRPAGYLIYNDASARDVQFPEMLLTGPATSKDFDTGNGIGPLLVTPEDLPDPLTLGVTVGFEDRPSWHGTTADYRIHPEELLARLVAQRSFRAGTIIGMGTIPGCCGLDLDQWLEPGEGFTITIERLGSLTQRFGRPKGMPRSRWGSRTGSA